MNYNKIRKIIIKHKEFKANKISGTYTDWVTSMGYKVIDFYHCQIAPFSRYLVEELEDAQPMPIGAYLTSLTKYEEELYDINRRSSKSN